jgi:NAD(P)-dependent dehydrogenase (short-subunit alcohol dehydrogenase family)
MSESSNQFVEGLLEGKTALVTGSSRGIGLEIARHFAMYGAHVMLSSRREENLIKALEIVKESSSGPGGVAYMVAKADRAEDAEACVNDILVNNAGTNPFYGSLGDIDESRALKTLGVNVVAPLLWTQIAWRTWMKDHGGVVLNMASTGALSTEHGIGWYNTSKAALVHLTKHLALDLSPSVRVNALAPGLIKTDMARGLWETHESELAAGTPLGRLGETRDVANAAVFLVSDIASWVTGVTLVVDGGALVRSIF